VRRGFYADSVALMRASRSVQALPDVAQASLMIGTPSNKALLKDAGMLAAEGKAAQATDLVIAVRARDAAAAREALAAAERLLDSRPAAAQPGLTRARGLGSALAALPGANLALISVPGEFAMLEARRALERGLHVMMFSDNVPLSEEVALKRLAADKGLLMMGPDCGTSLIAGTPLAFANAVPRGDIGIVAASGTGLQEVSCLLARAGRGVSHAIGVGGRDLSEDVGGIMTFAAIDALESHPGTRHVVISAALPGSRAGAREGARSKRFTLCLLGASVAKLPPNARFAPTLLAAAESAAGQRITGKPLAAPARRRGWVRGLFCGGTLCAEAQLVLLGEGVAVRSNAPVPGAREASGLAEPAHVLLDLGDDEYTRGRPHPMIDPSLRNELLAEALRDPQTALVLLDVVIGYGAHSDPASLIEQALAQAGPRHAVVIASVTGTESDPQGYARQVAGLERASVLVAPSNAHAAQLAARALSSPSAPRSSRRAASRTRSSTSGSAGARPGRRGASRRGKR
jgi:FdrA protein